MKVLTKHVNLMGEEFVLISDKSADGKTYFATIPYYEIDSAGRLKRLLNGFDMCISFKDTAEALENRINQIKVDRFKAEGFNEVEVMMFILSGYTAHNWDMELFEKLKQSFNKVK